MAALTAVGPALAGPGDILELAAPALGSDPPKAESIGAGDASVATQTGAFTYSYPLTLPAGRGAATPQVALSYSSQGEIYGGIAAGWTLGVPAIEAENRGVGRLTTQYSLQAGDKWADDRFSSGLAGGQLLVPVDEGPSEPLTGGVYKRYRAKHDSTWVRYERFTPPHSAAGGGPVVIPPMDWRALAPDGNVYRFGERTLITGEPKVLPKSPLTSMTDAFGNTVEYLWTYSGSATESTFRLDQIRYGKNAGAGLADVAVVNFNYAAPLLCNGAPIGAQFDYATGQRIVEGATPLSSIAVQALDGTTVLHERIVTLTYDAGTQNCVLAQHTPFRQLNSIQETARHLSPSTFPQVALPAVTFEYGGAALSFDQPHATILGALNSGVRMGPDNSKGRWAQVEHMYADLDGDGLQDRLEVDDADSASECILRFSRNRGVGQSPQFADAQLITLPRLPWTNDGAQKGPEDSCSLAGQYTKFTQVQSATCPPNVPGCIPAGQTNDGAYLAYRWMDLDTDGLPELVTAIHWDRPFFWGPEVPPGTNGAWHLLPNNAPSAWTQWPACEGLSAPCPDLNTNHNGTDQCDSEELVCMGDVGDWAVAIDDPSAGMTTCGWATEKRALPATTQPEPCPGTQVCPPPPPADLKREPLQMCQRYPWLVQANQGINAAGQLVLAEDADVLYAPHQLDSDDGNGSFGKGGSSVESWGHVDLDGDGMLDLVDRKWQPGEGSMPANAWYVFRGQREGDYSSPGALFKSFGDQPYLFSVPDGAELTRNTILFPVTSRVGLVSQLADFNNDGLPDLWREVEVGSQKRLGIYLNNGLGFRHSAQLPEILFPYQLFSNAWGESTRSQSYELPEHSSSTPPYGDEDFFEKAWRVQTQRIVDVDADGRPDIVHQGNANEPLASAPYVQWNLGSNVSSYKNVPVGSSIGLLQYIEATADNYSTGPYRWQSLTDYADFDGDGIPEVHDNRPNGQTLVHNVDGKPPRLLTAVVNGRGARVDVRYASLNDKTPLTELGGAPVVTQSPHLTEANGLRHASPQTMWVVKTLTKSDIFESSSSVGRYRYVDPMHGPNDDGRWGFRGFAEVEHIAPTGASTLERFGYDVDWSGRKVETLTRAPDGSGYQVKDLSKTTWTKYTLALGSHIDVFLATKEVATVCRANQTKDTCGNDPAARVTTETVYQPLTPAGHAGATALALVPTTVSTYDGASFGEDDRKVLSSYHLHSAAGSGNEPRVYRLQATASESRVRQGGVDVTFAKLATTYDPSWRVVMSETAYSDATTTHVTSFETDLATGQVLSRRKPAQQPSGPSESYVYDASKRFVVETINEVGLSTETITDPGTGAVISSKGPNVRTCTSNCPPNTPIKEERNTKIDGLGRPLEVAITRSENGSSYTLSTVERASYVDAATSTVPASVTAEKRIEHTQDRWVKTKTEVDGSGRPIKVTSFAQGDAPFDAVTSYDYDSAGQLIAVSVPDPSANTGAQVTFVYEYDVFGRPTKMLRPDATALASRSGVEMTYSGLTSTTTELLGTQPGQAASRQTLVDPLGRLVEVRERVANNNNAADWVLTTYAYSPRDEVMTITAPGNDVDPYGTAIVTDLEHDWLGRRTSVSRADRTWSFVYDANGNLEAEVVPFDGAISPENLAAHTTTHVYDAIDREISRSVALRNLSAADLALFGIGTWTFDWDMALYNRQGRLVSVQGPAGPGGQPVTQTTNTYDAEGNLTKLGRVARIAGVTIDRDASWRYATFGKVNRTFYADNIPGASPAQPYTESSTIYDNRGLPKRMEVVRTGYTAQSLAVQTRNVAGLVTSRKTTQSGTMPSIESRFTYDNLGRVTQQLVDKNANAVELARQTLTYGGSDDPLSLMHSTLGGLSRTFAFGYDKRHQLTSAMATRAGGTVDYNASWHFGPSGRLAGVDVAATTSLPGSEVKPRQVDYEYAGGDPEQVTALSWKTAVGGGLGGTDYATYVYDAVGNVTTRTHVASGAGGGTAVSWAFVYDGEDQLRRATNTTDGTVEEYWYDHSGNRIAVARRPSASAVPSEIVYFIGDTEITFAGTPGTGVVTKTSAHLSMGTPVARVENRYTGLASLEYQFHGLGSNTLIAVGASTGEVNAGFTYAPFGDLIEAVVTGGGGQGGIDGHRRRLTDKYVDKGTGLSYFGARYYDPLLIGWTQGDPLYRVVPDAAWTEPRRGNLYSFVLGNPMRYVDPDGRDSLAQAAEGELGQFIGNGAMAAAHKDQLSESLAQEQAQILALNMGTSFLLALQSRGGKIGAWAKARLRKMGIFVVNGVISGMEITAQAGIAILGTMASGAKRVATWAGDAVVDFFTGGGVKELAQSAVWSGGPNWKSGKQFGHTFIEHGAKRPVKQLIDRARSTGDPQGQWLDNDAAADLMYQHRNIAGPVSVSIPEGMGQVVLPNGEIIPARRARLIPSLFGFKTGFPVQ